MAEWDSDGGSYINGESSNDLRVEDSEYNDTYDTDDDDYNTDTDYSDGVLIEDEREITRRKRKLVHSKEIPLNREGLKIEIDQFEKGNAIIYITDFGVLTLKITSMEELNDFLNKFKGLERLYTQKKAGEAPEEPNRFADMEVL